MLCFNALGRVKDYMLKGKQVNYLTEHKRVEDDCVQNQVSI